MSDIPSIEELKRRERDRERRHSLSRLSFALSFLAFPTIFCLFSAYHYEYILNYVWWAVMEFRWFIIVTAAIVLFIFFVAATCLPEEWLEEKD